MAETFPSPAALALAAADAMSGTVHERTQLPYLAAGISQTTSPTYAQQYYRLMHGLYRALAGIAAGMAYKTHTLEVGVLPFRYRKADGTDVHYEGGVIGLTASQTNSVYVDVATNTLGKSIAGWPVDITTFVAIAEYECSASDILTADDAADRRGLNLFQIHASSSSPTGTTATAFTLDNDNEDAGNDQQVRFNRGSTDAEDAALEWDETNDRLNCLSQHDTGTLCPFNAETYQVGGADLLTADGAAAVQSGVAGDGLKHAAGVLAVDVDGATIETAGNAVRLKDGGITTAKLGDTLADKLVQISIGDASGASPQLVTIQAKDIQGNNLAEVIYLEVGVFDDADGGTVATNASISVGMVGTLVRTVTAGKRLICKTSGGGALTITVTNGVAETVYLLAATTFHSRLLDCADIGTVVIS